MELINKFTNELQAIAEGEITSNDEIKKRLLRLANEMDEAGARQLEKLSYRMIELIDEFPENINDIIKLEIAVANEDWLKVGEVAKPLLDIKAVRELTEKAGMKPSI
jgi:hypothetical protein